MTSEPSPETWDASATLILVDLQLALDDPSWGVRNNREAEDRALQLLERWRDTDRPIVHVRHVSRSPMSTFRPNQPGIEFKPATAPFEGELVITKHRPGAMTGTPLEQALRQHQIRQLVLVGAITENSIESTARAAADLGFDVTIASDATFTFGRRDFEGVERTADDIHAMSLANLDGEYARIWTTDRILGAT